ncbi:helix-turn-helix domain-containing protein [Lysinibacillus sp. G4S2]|uniref:helix-turn-helix domain-containing protein n=2 Tax=unclassified Lysinibacillus TaxID=2636778 RepID=UPI002557AD4A|nr:helix-turn-helix domain-containing protein [Lysinibacillus sp. fls2-241-R2A-57]MDM5249398.1 helix-turn-helix domain-containing protein [Lysinibacillus sp. G4S2]
MKMSLAVIQKTQESIDLAFQTKDADLLEKETQFLLYSLGDFIPDTFSESVRYIQLRETKLKPAEKLMSDTIKLFFDQALELLDEKNQKKNELGAVKLAFEKLFLETTDCGYIDYDYDIAELVSTEQAAEYLGVSKPTIYKYLNNGLEHKLINNVKKIPRVALKLWSDPATSFEMQWIHQEKKRRTQTLEEKLEVIQGRITEYEIEYGGEFEHLYGNKSDSLIDGLDEAVDVFDWKGYIVQKNALLKQLQANKGTNA